MRWSLVFTIFLFTACGKLEQFKKSVENFSPLSPKMDNLTQPAGSTSSSPHYTPGSYFGVVTESGPNKDTLVYEFQYLSGNKFLIRKTNFLQGKPESGYFHKKTGTFTEANGIIQHTVDYDSCSDRSPLEFKLTGDKEGAIQLTYNSVTYPLFSQSGYAFSSTIGAAMANIVEDVGCKVFPAQ